MGSDSGLTATAANTALPVSARNGLSEERCGLSGKIIISLWHAPSGPIIFLTFAEGLLMLYHALWRINTCLKCEEVCKTTH